MKKNTLMKGLCPFLSCVALLVWLRKGALHINKRPQHQQKGKAASNQCDLYDLIHVNVFNLMLCHV